MPRQFNAHYTASLVPNKARGLPFTPSEMWSRSYTMYLQLHIFRIQYTVERISAIIVDISTIQYALYCKHGAKLQRTTTSLRNVNCGPGHIQCIYSSAYSDFNIHLNVTALLLEISRQFNERYAAHSMPNKAHNHQFTQCELRSRTYTMHLHLRIFRLQYSTERICAAIWDISITKCSLYCKRVAKYSAHPPVNAMQSVAPDIHNAFTAPHIKASLFNWTYLRWYRRYVDNSMRLILQTWCQLLRASSSLRYLNCGLGHIQCIYTSAYSDFNIHLNVTALILEKPRQFNESYAAHLVPNTAHNHQITQCELRSRTYTMHLQLRIFRLQYSSERISAAIGDISTIQCGLYCKLCAKYSAHPPVCAIWTVVPDIFNVYTVLHIQASTYSWMYLRHYCRYIDNSICFILETRCQI
jgi:hypothetical protein